MHWHYLNFKMIGTFTHSGRVAVNFSFMCELSLRWDHQQISWKIDLYADCPPSALGRQLWRVHQSFWCVFLPRPTGKKHHKSSKLHTGFDTFCHLIFAFLSIYYLILNNFYASFSCRYSVASNVAVVLGVVTESVWLL